MISSTVQDVLAGFVPKENILYKEPLKKHTTFQVGGEADCLILIENEEQMGTLVRYLNRVELPWMILGNGSNLLVSDRGFEGVVLKTKGSMDSIRVDGDKIYAQAGALLSQVAKAAYEAGLAGMEFAAGIPGTIGGAVVMNAGAYGGEMAQVIRYVNVVDASGEKVTLDNETMEFGYRTSVIKKRPFVVTDVELCLRQGDKEAIKARMDELAATRREKQPLEFPSAGSTFKRPEGYFAGKLIMDAGLRGFRIGGAAVSEKHCGFVINIGNATAQDISDLMDEVSDRVYKRFKVRLEPEVIKIGSF